jgi:iron complex transport system substrate-binding protein
MKRLLSLILLCALLSACTPAPEAGAGYTFTDDLGRTVTVDSPQRVACLLGSFADIWTLAGGEVIAAPDDAWVDYELPMAADAVDLGSTKELSLESLFAADPDLVLASVNTEQNLAWREILEGAQIPVAYFEVSDFDGYLRLLKTCTDLTGRPDRYEEYGLSVQKQIQEAVEKAENRGTKPKVLYLRISSSAVRAKNSKGTVLGQMLQALGCENLADADGSLLEQISMEHILLEDPDFIFFVQQGDDTAAAEARLAQFLADNPAWGSLTAVQEGRVFHLDKALYNLKPNARWGEAYLELEAILREN